jgi:hypothetical protein
MPPVDENDVINNGLPTELQGKTPAEIAAYYADREQTILGNARRMVTEAQEGNRQPGIDPPPVPPTPRSGSENVTREEFTAVTNAAREGLINMAKLTASQGKPDWSRLLPEVERIMKQLSADLQIDSAVWSETYFNVRGRMTDTLVNEAHNRALGLEPVSPPPTAPTPPRVFTSGEIDVVEGMGITTEMYADAEKKLESNYQPFTTDNRRRA